MNIGFLLFRKGNLKGIGPVIAEAMKRGHSVYLFYDSSINAQAKAYENLASSDLRAWPQATPVEAPVQEWPRLFREYKIATVLVESAYGQLSRQGWFPRSSELSASQVKIASLSHLWEVVVEPPESLTELDVIFYWSLAQQEMHHKICRLVSPALPPTRAQSVVVGSSMFDQKALINTDKVRERLGIAPGQKVVVLVSLKMKTGDPWRRAIMGDRPLLVRLARAVYDRRLDLIPEILRGGTYRTLFDALRGFCDRQHAFLIVKSKQKNGDPSYLKDGADYFCYDESDYPYTSLELMSIADLVIHFGSAAVFEAAYAGVPSISVRMPHEHISALSPQLKVVTEEFRKPQGPEGIFDWPGVVSEMDRHTLIHALKTATLSTFTLNPDARSRYVKRFVGFDDQKASERMVMALEHIVAAHVPQGAGV